VNEQFPLPVPVAARAVARCAGTTAGLLVNRRITMPRTRVGMRLHFGDGTTAAVYRETAMRDAASRTPCVLVVEFRLRVVRRQWAHALFRRGSLLNTPLFAGFPGFVSKLWLAHDEHGVYRGLYEWDGADRAEAYARALWRVLALVSVRGSIHYRVLPGLARDDVLEEPRILGETTVDDHADWWRLVAIG